MMNRFHLSIFWMFTGLCLVFSGSAVTSALYAQEEALVAEEPEAAEPEQSEAEDEVHAEGDTHSDADHDDAGHGEGEHDDAGHDDGHAPAGPPLNFRMDLALWSFISFGLLVLVLRTFAWGPLTEGLDNREAHFRNQLAEAEAARIQAERMLKEHAAKLEAVQDEVRAIIEEAKRDAEHTKNDIIQTAQKEAKATQDRAIHEIERSKDAALKELFDTMSSQVASATEHVLGRSMTGDDQNRLIDEALSQFSGS